MTAYSTDTRTLRCALQKSGRTTELALELLRSTGMRIVLSERKLAIRAENMDFELLLVRSSDIPLFLERGIADCALVGENTLREAGSDAEIQVRTGLARCRLMMAVPEHGGFKDIASLQGKMIATSYPKLLAAFLEQRGVTATIASMAGSVELAPGIGLADAICDIVSTGSTLKEHGLSVLEEVFASEMVFATARDLRPQVHPLVDDLCRRFSAAIAARGQKYVLFDAPRASLEAIKAFLPCAESPTVCDLVDNTWVSIAAVMAEDDLWRVLPDIKASGGRSILVLPVEKVIM